MKNNPKSGTLPDGWQWCELGEIAEIIMGQSPPGNTYNETGKGLPFFQGKAEFGDRFPSAVKWCSEPKKIAQSNDILMSVRAPVGPVNLCSADRCCIGRGLSAIRVNPKLIHYLYLYHFLKLNETNISRMGQGSTFSAIGRNDIRSIKIPLPPLPTQRRIVAILEKADAVRRKRRLADEKTSQILQAAFVKMFGDPVRNEMGWEVRRLGEVCDINPPKNEVSNLPENTEVSFLPMASVSENGTIVTQEIRRLFEVKKGFTYFREGDVLLAKITPCMENGKRAIATSLRNGIGFGSTEFHVLRPKEKTNSEWLFGLISLSWFRTAAANNMVGTAGQQRVPADFLENLKTPLPPLKLQQKFAALVERVEAMRERQAKSREKVESTFQALMQKAFRGELVA